MTERDEYFNTFLGGDLSKVADILGGDNPPVIDAGRLRAILTNICDKSDRLHNRIARLERVTGCEYPSGEESIDNRVSRIESYINSLCR